MGEIEIFTYMMFGFGAVFTVGLILAFYLALRHGVYLIGNPAPYAPPPPVWPPKDPDQ